jgi:hypothetical protein
MRFYIPGMIFQGTEKALGWVQENIVGFKLGAEGTEVLVVL